MTTALNMVKTGKYANDKLIGVRHVQCILCFFCLTLAYAMRVNLTVAIVAMRGPAVNTTLSPNGSMDSNLLLQLGSSNRTGDSSAESGEAADSHSSSSSWNPLGVEFYNHTGPQESLMLSSFFWGYIVTQIPGGYIAQRYGAKSLLMVGMAACSILTLISPLSLRLGGWVLLVVVRVLEGLTQGAVHPATHSMLAKWAPASERGLLGTLCYSGAQFGTIITLATGGYIADSFTGWPGIFYFGGICGFLWVLLWWIYAASTPDKHRSITPEELKFIEETRTEGKMQESHKMAPTPWMAIFTSMPFLSLMIVHCTHMYGFWTLLTQIPRYMLYVYDVDIKTSALLGSLPYIVMMVLSFFFVWLSKVLAKNKSISVSFNRKFFNSIGHWIPMCSLIGLGYVPQDNYILAVVLLTLTVGISAATYLGFQVNHIDLSPNYAGTLMGITNGAANIMSGVAPLVVGFIIPDVEKSTVYQWRMVFFLAAFFYFLGNLLFVVFGRTETQWWDTPDIDAESVEAGVPLAGKYKEGAQNGNH